MSLVNKLSRMKAHLNIEPSKKTIEAKEETYMDRFPFIEEWKKNHASLVEVEGQYCLMRKIIYPHDYVHGKYSFQQLKNVVKAWQSVTSDHPLSVKDLKIEDLLFFDTETTGLGGGVGNTIFLLGYATWKDRGIEVTQLFLPSPNDEIAFYQTFINENPLKCILTYNGKSFDWPQVQSRHTLVKNEVDPLPNPIHLDLYHASRRLYKEELDSVKLVQIEKDILSFERKDDTPGYLAPMIYFDYLDRKNPEGIFSIMKHNEEDVLSLITLFIHLSEQVLELKEDQTDKEKLKIGKWFKYLGEQKTALSIFQSIQSTEELDIRASTLHHLGFFAKQRKEYDVALKCWLEVMLEGNEREKKESYYRML
ncbi:ribonuclease H-like domain-containing protein [Bacillus coahuilensis]|uniref:ribonuclease H-like domain-containing protein n=1 Tax=Bacillus coahuilensis TaxID=408580 RepID=UPI0007515E11|nr:ribonuclease H-like domain-containing protein [Bacillus coahuilensis]